MGVFPKEDGSKEYRVIEAQAIDNVDYGDADFQDHMRLVYFGKAKPMTKEEADREAERMAEETLRDLGILEYGISTLQFERPLINKTLEEAHDWLAEKDREQANAQGKVCCGNLKCASTKMPSEKDGLGNWFCSSVCVRAKLERTSKEEAGELTGIYILQTQTIDSQEWRVALLTGEEYNQLFCHPATHQYTDNIRVLMENARNFFGKSEVFTSKTDALVHADVIAQHIETFFGIVSLNLEAIF